MRRLFGSISETGRGAVYRQVGTTNECIDSFVVPTLDAPTCEIYPATAEHLASFPYHFGVQDDIDFYAFISEFSILDGVTYDSAYPNMWHALDTAAQNIILAYADACFCAGEGIDIVRLVTGRPRFPRVDPIPWFYIPTANTPTPFSVRTNNPDGPPLDDTCCPDDGEIEGITANVVGGELQLQHRKRPDKEYILRKEDTKEQFQRLAGYPRWCCLPHPNEAEKYVMRYLDFPMWPRIDTHNPDPDTLGAGKEPLGVVPVVVDIGCTAEGLLKIYWANIIVHDGRITEIQWDVAPPRPGPFAGFDYNVPPDDPEVLDVNKDYQNVTVLVDGFDSPVYSDGIGDTCDLAAGILGLTPCTETCPTDICPPGGILNEVTGSAATEQGAIDAAYAAAVAAMGGCSEPIHFCFVKENAAGEFEATVTYCCV